MGKVKLVVGIIVTVTIIAALILALRTYNQRVENSVNTVAPKNETIKQENKTGEMSNTVENKVETVEQKNEGMVVIEVNGKVLELEMTDAKAAKELKEKLQNGSIVVKAEDYGEFEKIGDLGYTLTKEDKQIETDPGDVVLYQGNKISIFYAPNAWEYTKLGKVTNVDNNELKNILGDGDVTLELKLK